MRRGLGLLFGLLVGLLGVIPAVAQTHFMTHAGDRVPDFARADLVTLTSTQDGLSTDPATWGGRLPMATDIVTMAHKVTFTGLDNVMKVLHVMDGGVFLCDSTPGRLTVQELLITDGGARRCGTPDAPATFETVFAGSLDTTFDPETWGMGMLVVHGVWQDVGQSRAGYAMLVSEPLKGQTTLTFAEPVTGWLPGDLLVIGDTRQQPVQGFLLPDQTAEVTIAGVDASTNTVTLTVPLLYDHKIPRDYYGKPPFMPHVANLTRSIVFRSATPEGTRGHVAFMGRSTVDVRYAGFKDLGRTKPTTVNNTKFNEAHEVLSLGTNQNGRYPVHGHHGQYPYNLEGIVVHGTRKWGVATHDTHYSLVHNSVCYKAQGACFVWEDGSETYDRARHNMAISVTAHADVAVGDKDNAIGGYGFWSRGSGVFWEDLVSVGTTGSGFSMMQYRLDAVTIPAYASADKWEKGQGLVLLPWLRPPGQMDNLIFYGRLKRGVDVWELNGRGNDYIPPLTQLYVFRRWKGYAARDIVFTYRSHGVEIEDLEITCDAALARAGSRSLGVQADAQYPTRHFVLRRPKIHGCLSSIYKPATDMFPDFVHSEQMQKLVGKSSFQSLTPAERATVAQGQPGLFRIEDADLWGFQEIVISNPLFREPGRQTEIIGGTFHEPFKAPTSLGMPCMLCLIPAQDRGNYQAVDLVHVDGWQGTPDAFDVYYTQSDPTSVMPASVPSRSVTGSEHPGWTNQQLADAGLRPFAGRLAPCTTTRPGIRGYACTAP